ncbi:MAG: phospho-sugar mutase [Clostridiaceae bacterium]|jgi:phosphoglucomutase|nr:phospho-sugar mutase [Clostridiaceae bacterium]
MNYLEKYNIWVENPYFDEETRLELMAIKNDEKEIEERFYRELEFGTGGLRGIIGAGTNRMNKYVVRKASQGLSNFILKRNISSPSIAIAYDSRHRSAEFAVESARVFARNGIKSYLFDGLRPTPELSFVVRHLNCSAGVVITASHNPKEYNGYKVYGKDGGQLPLSLSEVVMEEVNKIRDITSIKVMDFNAAKEAGLIEMIGQEIDDEYIESLKTLSVLKIDQEVLDKCRIIYTPIHGAGNIPVRRILKETGFNNIYVVPEQELPDPDFSTVKYPNPEEKAAFVLAISMAKDMDVDLIIGTDPDCDRVGVVVKNRNGEYVTLTGNQTGCLLMEYILQGLKRQGKLPPNGFVVKTIVTTELARKIADFYNVKLVEVLTGFKFIGEQILHRDEQGNEKFIFGFEESYGYLAGTFVRDKDAVVASMLIAEMYAWYKSRNLTLYDGIMELYDKYGYEKEGLDSFTLDGREGVEKIQNAMNRLRDEQPSMFGNIAVKAIRDYEKKIRIDIENGTAEPMELPKSNVLYYETKEGFWFCIRPSGTEPKIKIYYGVSGASPVMSEEALNNLKKQVLSKIRPLLS